MYDFEFNNEYTEYHLLSTIEFAFCRFSVPIRNKPDAIYIYIYIYIAYNFKLGDKIVEHLDHLGYEFTKVLTGLDILLQKSI